VVQAGLVGLHGQQVGGAPSGDQPVGVGVLGVHGVGGDDPPGKVQPLQQRPELGDLVGLGVHLDLGQDRTGAVVHHRQQVHLQTGVVAAAAQGLAVDRGRLPPRPGWGGCWPASQAPMARSSASPSVRASTRRKLASPGTGQG
jgi:hypothetical protein